MSDKNGLFFAAYFLCKQNQILIQSIWKAYCRDTVQLIDWQCGGRDQATVEKLMERLKKCPVKLSALIVCLNIRKLSKKISYDKANLKLQQLKEIIADNGIGWTNLNENHLWPPSHCR